MTGFDFIVTYFQFCPGQIELLDVVASSDDVLPLLAKVFEASGRNSVDAAEQWQPPPSAISENLNVSPATSQSPPNGEPCLPRVDLGFSVPFNTHV